MISLFIVNARAIAARVITDRKGVTAAEYAVLATGIVLVVGIAATALGGRLSSIFGTVGT
jgi:Flp pilus assembly pilin Flp